MFFRISGDDETDRSVAEVAYAIEEKERGVVGLRHAADLGAPLWAAVPARGSRRVGKAEMPGIDPGWLPGR